MIIIVSGSRWAGYQQRREIATRLVAWDRCDGQVTLVHGDADGVDRIAAGIAEDWGWKVTPVPAKWDRCEPDMPEELGGCPPRPHLRSKVPGRWYCPFAGPRRNQLMLDAHPDAEIGLCFPAVDSGVKSGTGDFIDRAIRAGLPIKAFPLRVVRPGVAALPYPVKENRR